MAEEAARTREQIVAAGRASFAARGFGATSTTAVAAAAGVTRGAVYHHFSDKTDLFRAVFLDLEHELNAAVTTAAAAESEPLAAVLAGCSALLDFAGRPDYQQIAVVDAPAVLGVAEWHRIGVGIGLDTMTRGLAALERSGVLARPNTPALAVLLFGALTEACLALARGGAGTPTRQELLDEFRLLITDPPDTR
jgi:AcrR family transcriptional regulator